MDNPRILQFRQAFRNLALQPLLTPENIEKFRVDYDRDTPRRLTQALEDCDNQNNKLIFAGHRGCGKSTLLWEFSRNISDRYFSVFFSVADLIESSDINHITILFAIAVQIMEKAKNLGVEIEASKLKSFYDWFKEHTKVEESTVAGGVKAEVNLFSIIKFNLQNDASTREALKTKFLRNPRELIDTINLIASEIEATVNQKIVVFIDDIDKLDLSQIDEIFHKNIKLLTQPRLNIIYSIPIATIRDGILKKHIEDETGNRIFIMPVLKLYGKGESHKSQPKPVSEVMEKLLYILEKRIDVDLFEPEALEMVALFSGGIIRELIRIAQECCRLMLTRLREILETQESWVDMRVDRAIVQEALDILRNDMAITLSKGDREILKQTYENYRPDDPKQQEFLDLLHNIYAIEYRNTDSWYDLHPLMTVQLRQEGTIE